MNLESASGIAVAILAVVALAYFTKNSGKFRTNLSIYEPDIGPGGSAGAFYAWRLNTAFPDTAPFPHLGGAGQNQVY